MVPPDIGEARADMRAAHTAYLTAVRTYTGTVGRQADPAIEQAAFQAYRNAADAYDATLQVLADCLTAMPPDPQRAAELTEVRHLQRSLRVGRRLVQRRQ